MALDGKTCCLKLMPEAPFEDHSDLSAASSASTHPNLAKMIADVPIWHGHRDAGGFEIPHWPELFSKYETLLVWLGLPVMASGSGGSWGGEWRLTKRPPEAAVLAHGLAWWFGNGIGQATEEQSYLLLKTRRNLSASAETHKTCHQK